MYCRKDKAPLYDQHFFHLANPNQQHELKVADLLKDLKITCTRLNKDKLLKIWKFMVSQSKTCLQGSSYYSFNFFDQIIIETYDGKSLNSSALWNSICKIIHVIFKRRKARAFENDGKYFSLRMFSTRLKNQLITIFIILVMQIRLLLFNLDMIKLD
jgi:hypothetical protein